jgi:hypothetical protein
MPLPENSSNTSPPVEGYDHLNPKEIVENVLPNLGHDALVQLQTYEAGRADGGRKTVLRDVEQRLAVLESSEQTVAVPGHPEAAKAAAEARAENDANRPEPALYGNQSPAPSEHTAEELGGLIPNLNKDGLLALRQAELNQQRPRKTVLEAVDQALKDPPEPERIEPFAEGTLRALAEKSAHDPDTPDPAEPLLNADYIAERDPEAAARHQEGVVSANVDDFAQRAAASEAAAEPLRLEAQQNLQGQPNDGGAHSIASWHAEEGTGWVDPLLYPGHGVDTAAATQEAIDEEAAGEDAARRDLRKYLPKLKGQKAVVPEYRDGIPLAPGSSEDEDVVMAEEVIAGPPLLFEPIAHSMQIGTLVSRVDFAHDEIGVVDERDSSSLTHQLVHVLFATEDDGWFSPSNLRYEGRITDLA